jgi:lipopolysaccharide transport system ATP-binding protein
MTIHVRDLGKCYPSFSRPSDRLRRLLRWRAPPAIDGFWALQDVSFSLPHGSSLGVVGKNGSGKSTLLQLICGTSKPTVGEIEVNGRIAALLELGSGFNPEFTGRENVYLNAMLLGLTREAVNDSFEEIESFADIGRFIDLPVKTYSSGMLVRLAVQVQVEPDILVVDEALAVGDALFQKRCFQRIEALRSRGTSLLFVSHDEESVRALTDQALLLVDGRVAALGPPSEVLLEYRRRLHDDESAYFAHVASVLARRAPASPPMPSQPAAQLPGELRSDKLSFGDREAEVLAVRTLDASGNPATSFYPTDRVRVEVDCVTHRPLERLNVALRLRNKEGVKIYSWGTLNQDMAELARNPLARVFWHRQFTAGEKFTVVFEWTCGLGANLYEVQASVSSEGKPYYAEQRMLHWRDEAAFFHVTLDQRAHHFGGVADLRMRAALREAAVP